MAQHQKWRITCIGSEGRLDGVISLSDIAQLDDSAVPPPCATSVAAKRAATPGQPQMTARADVGRCYRQDTPATIAVARPK